jgi:hypothetical protein
MGVGKAALERAVRYLPQAPSRWRVLAVVSVVLAAAVPGQAKAALDPLEIGLSNDRDAAVDPIVATDAGWPPTRPVPRPEHLEEIEVSLLDAGPVLHGLLLPAEGAVPAGPARNDALAGLFWLLAFLALLAGSAVRLELRAQARRSAWKRRVSDSYDA